MLTPFEKKSKKTKITVSVSPELLASIENMSEELETGLNRSQLVSWALSNLKAELRSSYLDKAYENYAKSLEEQRSKCTGADIDCPCGDSYDHT